MDKANALGDYLRARRDLVRPEDIGLIPGCRRKVPGLHREELTMLDIAGTGGLQVVLYHAEPGTESAQALALLGSIAATGKRDAADRAAADKDGTDKDGTARAPAPAGRHGSSNPEKETP